MSDTNITTKLGRKCKYSTDEERRTARLEKMREWRAKQHGPDWTPKKRGRKPIYTTEDERKAAKKAYLAAYYRRMKEQNLSNN